MESNLPSLFTSSKKPSEFIKTKEEKSYKIHVSNESQIPIVVDLERQTLTNCSISLDRPLFQPEPSNLTIEGFSPFKTYELVISFRNVDKVPRKIRIEKSDNPYFTVTGWKKLGLQSEKVAPGMEIQYVVKFSPEERVDYVHELICVTEREKFIVPIKAVGARGYLDFPDQFVFSDTPVRFETKKNILVRNVGDAPAKFEIVTSSPFQIEPSHGYLEIDQTMQFTVAFYPKQTGSFQSCMYINYAGGAQMKVELYGSAENMNIRLDKSNIRVQNTISLTSQKTVKLMNRSDFMVKYEWKRCVNETEEAHLKARRSMDLAKAEEDEILALEGSATTGKNENLAISLIKRKYQNKNLEVEDLGFSFEDEFFRIEPKSGILWPGSTVDATVYYRPSKVGDHSTVAYCEVEGRESRLPLQLKGTAIGPKVKFSYTAFRIGEIFINTSHKYEILLENVGGIKSKFSLAPNKTLFGPKFQFIPDHGVISVGEQLVIEVIFNPDILGNFKEDFLWELEGGSENLHVSFTGAVVGPTFEFDRPKLILPTASLGFTIKEEFTLSNTSQIPTSFRLQILNDHGEGVHDVKLTKSFGEIPAMSKIPLAVEFHPTRIDSFAANVVVHVDSVGDYLLRLPIEAKSVVPIITVRNSHIEMKECFLDYTYTEVIELVNDSPFMANFEIPIKENSRNSSYFYSFELPGGVIQPHSTVKVSFIIRVKRLGAVLVPIFINVIGSSSPPLAVEISVTGVGASITYSANELDWGKIPVLATACQSLTLENTSPIPAKFSCALTTDVGCFTIEPSQGDILPGQKARIQVSAYLDDAAKFTDILKVYVASSETRDIPIIAKGFGSTIVYDNELKAVDFQDVFSNQECSASFTMYNKGRRMQHIAWSHLSTKDPDVLASQIFEVIPQRFTLKPRSHQVFFIKSRSNVAAKISDKLLCYTNSEKDPTRKLLLESSVSVNFINPLVRVTPESLCFNSTHTTDDQFQSLEQMVTLKNTTSLPLTVNLKCPFPFSVQEKDSNLWLLPNAESQVTVSFDPSHHFKRISVKETGKLILTYGEHPQKDSVPLCSEVYFPNLTFDRNSLSFGCIQNQIEQKRSFNIANTSSLPVIYQWYFLENESTIDGKLAQAFDIRPLHGRIEPGKSQEVTVFFFGHPEERFDAKAICDVAGGPKYEMPIQGEASAVLFSLDKSEINFDTIGYQTIVDQELSIENNGSVSFEYQVFIDKKSSLFSKLVIFPSYGTINQKSKQRLTLRFCPGVPEEVDDFFQVKIGDFEPVKVRVVGMGVFPRLSFSLPHLGHNDAVIVPRPNFEEKDIEFNQERESLKVKSMKFLKDLEEEVRKVHSSEVAGKFIGSILLYQKGQQKGTPKDQKMLAMTESASVPFGTYLFDLGTVIRNTTTRKTFTVMNTGVLPISFALQKPSLLNSGFIVEPERIKNLPPGETLEFTVSFYAKMDSDSSEVEFPIQIVGGPTVYLRLIAKLAVPELKINDNQPIDFGEVFHGFRKGMVLIIENASEVGCDWSFSPVETESKLKKQPKSKVSIEGIKDFEVIPLNGYLEPLAKSTIMIRFCPKESKIYNLQLPFKVAMNAKPVLVSTQAIGTQLSISFDPPSLTMGPILPYGDGTECKITLHNPVKTPIELFCTNFDTQFKQDEELLKQLDLNENGAIYLPPRDLDLSFNDYLLEFGKKKNLRHSSSRTGSRVGDLNKISNSGHISSESIATNDCFNVIVYGPPLSGKTAQANRIATLYGKMYITLDMIVEKSQAYSEMFPEKAYKPLEDKSDDDEAELKSWDDSKALFSEEAVHDFVKSFFQDNSNSKGYVLDGFDCKYSSNISGLMKLVTKTLIERGKRLHIFHITLDLQRMREKEQYFQALQTEKKLSILRVKELSEEEYDMLSQSEKDNYDSSMLKYKRKVKELEEKRPKERRLVEEDLSAKGGDKKVNDDRIKRRGPPSRVQTSDKEKTGTPPQKEKVIKKPLSPKFGRKAVGEKGDKHDKDRLVDTLGEETLTEDSFMSELTFRRVDIYYSTVETALTVFKDGKESEKTNKGNNQNFNSEKKSKAAKQVELTAPVSALDSDNHSLEEAMAPEYHELNANVLDEEAIFKLITDIVPPVLKEDATKTSTHHVIESWVEQMFVYRSNRQKVPSQKIFSLLANFSVSEETENHGTDTGTVLPTISAPAAPPPKGLESSKADLKKGGTKQAVSKTVDEKNILETEEDEKDNGQYRWILQGGEKKDIVIRFNPIEAARTDLMLNFEITGWPQDFSLPIAGLCQYSQILVDYKKIFDKTRKIKEEKDLVQGEFILSTSTFEFGPLLYNKPRDKYMEKFPENRANMVLTNPGSTEIKVFFGLKNDVKQDTFFFEPQTLSILPGKTGIVTLWAYPKSAIHFEDIFIISIKDNPEPFMFKVTCVGVKPELEVDRKTMNFEKLLVGRNDKRELKIKNPTLMPVHWRIAGLESLGDEFNVHPMEGIVESLQDVVVTADFRGLKASVIKRVIKFEVSDPDRISGVVHDIPVVVTAEAYDIAMDIHFPKGFEGGIDFGVIKVSEEGKQLVTLKNKGKYEVGFKFIFDSPHFSELLSITPVQGIIQPSEKPYFVQIVFKSASELAFKDYQVLKCIVFEPATGEITASIPAKVSGRAVFSKYSILPARDLNFGALVHGTKAAKQFTLENNGEFDFKFNIFKQLQDHKGAKKQRTNSPPPGPKIKKDVTKGDFLSFGVFSVFPTSGVVLAGTKLLVTVDFHADSPGSYDEVIGIDVSDRSPSLTDGLEYQLLGESCVPGINISDFASIFEEQTVCKRLELFKTQNNAYGEEDRAFFFGAYLAGQQVQVQFKISNPFKVGCEVLCSTKPRGKTKSDLGDFAFDLEPKKLTIPSHEHRYVTVMFHPTSIQTYSGLFEAVVENVVEGKNKTLSFELRGEGTLPRINVEKPTLKSKAGFPLLKFRRLMIGASQTLSILLKNDGIIPAKMKLEWAIKDNEDFFCSALNDYQSLKPGETRTIDVKCQPSSIRRLEGELRLKVLDNSFEDSSIVVMGEGYMDDVTIEGFGDELENELYFSDCYVGETRSLTFKLKNHSTDWIRASFSEIPDFFFSPNNCHIKPRGGERDITVSFAPKTPAEVQKTSCIIKASKIKLSGVSDTEWDDRMKVVRWNSEGGKGQKKVLEPIHEPPYDILSSLADFQILLNGFADYANYECECSRIHFKSTLMFQSRVFRFPIRNVGKVSIKFSCEAYQDESLQLSNPESPFSVTPASGKILPGELVMVTVRFSPNDVGEYSNFIYFNMSNLGKDMKPLVIEVGGYSLRPFCHFELEDTDPLSIESRTPERSMSNGVPIVLEPNTKIIEFKSCGIKLKNLKRFYIVNPTQTSYDFVWKHESVNDSKCFKCLTMKGTVASGKKSEIVFEFNPENLDTKESLWSFNLLDHEVQIPFLLIGYATEPNVYISQTGINFKSVLVGRHAREELKLVNDEMIPFTFNFNDNSTEMGNEGLPVLKFNPTTGTVPPQSEIPIEIQFSPSSEKMFNFNLVCNIRKKPTPISVNVKGEGYKIHESLMVEMADGSNYELGPELDSPNIIDFGIVQINDKRVKRIIVSNTGKYNFDFSWKSSKRNSHIYIVPEIGTVMKGEKVFCELVFSPTTPIAIKDFRMVCQVLNGKSFPVSVIGSGAKPLVKFNVLSIDFGTQFILKSGASPVSRNLEITNNDFNEMAIEVVSTDFSWIELPRGIYTLSPSETKVIPVTFFPRDSIVYNDTLKFEINGLSTIEIPVQGEGSDFRIEAEYQNISFGALRIGQSSFRTIKITNKSKISAPLSIGPANTLLSLNMCGVNFGAISDIILRPKASVNLELKFQPLKRISPFSEEISLEFNGNLKPLLYISGACQGVEVRLENDTLPFGAVVQKSLTSRRIQLQNIGDIGAKFTWESQKLFPNFSISPMEGYISPGMDIPLEITFHPVELNPDVRAENILCKIEGAATISLTLSGMCIPQPLQSDTLKFSSPARTTETKSITLTNKTNSYWHISPIIENDAWFGPETLDLEPGQSKTYDITFHPMESVGNGEGGRHEGNIFFPLPDGTGILYRLNGNVDKPLPAGNISREFPCKTVYTEVIPISNWLRRAQKFRVLTEFAKNDGSIVFKGHDFVDLAPLLSKDYKFTFYSYKEGAINFKIIFKNEYTQEYIFYNLTYKITPSGIASTIDITAPIRMLQTRDVTLSNPLIVPVTFSCSSNHPEVTVPHSLTLAPKSDGTFTIEFLPLQPKESVARIVLSSLELGTYQYDLKLNSIPSGLERSLHFKVGLGNQQVQTFRFISFAKVKTDYTCKIDNAEFTVEKTISAPAATNNGVEVAVDISYEPSRLGDTRTQLVVSSPTGGDYICPLFGHCISPKPQGPIIIKQGATSSVSFKNVFTSSAVFNCVVDNPLFQVKPSETVPPKKTISISIGYKVPTTNEKAQVQPPPSSKIQNTKSGKLTITNPTTNISWVYYLKYSN